MPRSSSLPSLSLPSLSPVALAAAALAITLAAGPAQALVTVDGNWSTSNASPVGPGDTLLPTQGLSIGNGGPGSLGIDGGSLLRVASLVLGQGGTGSGNGLLTGTGSRLELTGDGFSQGSLNRFEVGAWGTASFTVADGATLDGGANAGACVGQFHYCSTYIGNAAGSNGTFTVTGAGSNASFIRHFFVGGVAVFHPPIDSFTFGTPGGATQGTVNVLAGGSLRTEAVSLGVAPGGGSPSGRERSFADVSISGAGSIWTVAGGSLEAGAAFMTTAEHPNAWATITIANGGKLVFEAPTGFFNGLNLTTGGGRTDMVVTGTGSAVDFNGGLLQVGRRLGTATLEVSDGARLNDLYYLAVGRDGSTGSMVIDGSGSVVDVSRNAAISDATTVAGQGGGVQIGRNGSGTLTVSNGGKLQIVSATTQNRGVFLQLGRDVGSSGTLNITGTGSLVTMSADSVVAGGGAAEAANPSLRVGYDGSGTLNITAGGKLQVQGNAVSTAANTRGTGLFIGGNGDASVGGHGVATVSGSGSALQIAGSDAFIGLGIGANSFGQLTIANQGVVEATVLNVGRSGGAGILRLDGGTLNLAGQFTGGTLSGAGLAIGTGGGSGTVTIANGSKVNITNMGSNGAGINIGGSAAFSGGEGSMTISNSSQVRISAAPGLGAVSVGRDGVGFLRVRDNSSLDLGDGSLYVGRFSGSDGTMIVSGNSTVTAGYVGVGRNATGDGGTGTLIVNGSTLTAQTIEIGANGYLGGNGTIVGTIRNFGVVNAGNSPGTLVVDGSFLTGSGGRLLLEVESDGHGGFNTDHMIFTAGSTVNLTGLDVTFRFLGTTDPLAFLNSGAFNVDNFFASRTANGDVALDDALFSGAKFSARSDTYNITSFAFSAAGVGALTVQAVPEPGTWALMLSGVALVAGIARRRRTGANQAA